MELGSTSTSPSNLHQRMEGHGLTVVLSEHGESDNYSETGKSCLSHVHSHRGLIFVIISTIFMALQAVIVSLLKDDINSSQVVSLRFGLILFMTLPAAVGKGVPLTATRQEFKFLMLRSFCGTVAMVLKYFAYQNMRVGDATAVFFGAPAVTGLLGRIFLKEPFHILEGFTIIMTIAGVLIIAQPPFLFASAASVADSENSLAGIIAAVGCMVMAATTIVILRVMGKRNIEPFKTMLYYAVVASILSGCLVPLNGEWVLPQCGLDRYLLIALGVLGFLGQALWTYALTLENAIYASILRTNEVVFAFLFEFLFLGVRPNLLSGIGTALIIIASLLLSAKQIYQARKSQENQQNVSKEAPKDNADDDEDDVVDELM
ncbi:Solute carrier family 35 member G1 [Holothuria leucospilota]|uniref:Solute carrier family 35 member G1 n=1 Tax=Holothuria leucospilota TaxID=206669 RepID=A0A9Q1C5C0_HOLLE|nr:Solute carrier family 35 member G1 [Holothuria leucospilota]